MSPDSKPTALRFVLAGLFAAVVAAAYFGGRAGGSGPASDTSALPTQAPPPAPIPPTVALPGREIVGAAHVLVTWRGAERAPAKVTRDKEEARARAHQALARLKGGTPFPDVVREMSDDETTHPTGGAIGNFERTALPSAFSDVAFALEVGALSGVVETPLGFHVIKRTR